jgi:hypothetical protein
MKGKESGANVSRQDNFRDTILQLFERADESTRMDMYMTYRDMRESFERVERSASPRFLDPDLARQPGNL